MQAGPLRHLVEIQQEVRTPDGMGGFTLAWERVGGKRWARVSPMRGDESLVHRQLQDRITHLVTMRWHPDITAAMRMVFKERAFNIREAHNVDERNIKLELRCEEGVAV